MARQLACFAGDTLKIKDLNWLPKRYTKEIREVQRTGDGGNPLIRNVVW
jgi:hypothetical protein